jgi:hypothetical protein
VGGWPVLTDGTLYPDADHDGMSDEWERAHQLNPRDALDGAGISVNGYTHLELFLNELAAKCQS